MGERQLAHSDLSDADFFGGSRDRASVGVEQLP